VIFSMSLNSLTEKDLCRELDSFRERFPSFENDQLFVLWFLRAFLTDDENEAANALVGGPKDKGIDAILFDDHIKCVILVQGKYREKFGGKNEHRADVTSFAQLAPNLTGNNEAFNNLHESMSAEVQQRLDKARKRVIKDGYQLRLYYVTLGRCSADLAKEAGRIAHYSGAHTTLDVIDGRQVYRLLSDYLDGVAPPVPSLDLGMECGAGVKDEGIFHRYDLTTDIESWVFSMTGQGVADVYEQAGNRLFARNVRGFLGSTEINRGMETTLKNEPQHFWYYNNGITIVCDQAEEIRSQGRNTLRVANPQIINGQQTTRVLYKMARETSNASVSVRVIRVPRDDKHNHFEALISQIVSATNWQNAIRASDLMANDRRQIDIERQFRKLGYWYVRKRQTKSEAKASAGTQRYVMIRKDELAQAVAGCDLDPSIVREGKENLFEERLYNVVFPTSDPYYYLTRYWLMRYVSYTASGYPERAYAKWLVLNFIWSHLGNLVHPHAKANLFCHEYFRANALSINLVKAIDAAFKASLLFFRAQRGQGAKAIDVSTFFQRRDLHTEFASFWKGSRNTSRNTFNRAWAKFEEALNEETQS
jgi:hypothetical protein